MRLIKKAIMALSFALAALCVCTLLLEGYLRVFKPSRNLTPGTFISDVNRRYKLRPHFTGKTFGQPYAINSMGFRDHDYDLLVKGENVERVLCVGDSFTFGVGLDLEDTYPKQLERLLQREFPGKRLEVVNCGVPSYNTVRECEFIVHEALIYKPDLIVLSYVFNDSEYTVSFTSSHNKFINALKDGMQRFRVYDFVIEKLHLINFLLKGLTLPDPQYRVQSLKHSFSDEYIGWQKNKEAFGLLSIWSKKNNIPIVYLIFPKLELLDKDYPYLFFHEKVKQALQGEPYILDMYPVFKGKRAEELWVNPFDGHPNKEANTLMVNALAGFLEEHRLIK